MKEELAALVRRAGNPVRAGNLAREYVQARILLGLQEAGAMIPLSALAEASSLPSGE